MDAQIKCLAYFLTTVEQAIKSGDWKVDGACDPDTAMKWAEHFLTDAGYHRNGISGEWQREI